MKILHISLSDASWGNGAEASLLHAGAPAYGLESALYVRYLAPGSGYHTYRVNTMADITASEDFKDCDLVHVHATQGFFRSLDVSLLKDKPVLWTLADCNAYTAECDISAHCNHWQKGCENCPQSNTPELKASRMKYLAAKKEAFAKQKLTIAYENEWQKEQLKTSILKDIPAVQMPFLYDERAFFPGNTRQARENLGLPLTSLVIIYHNELASNTEKVTKYLMAAMSRFADDINQVYVVNIGHGAKLADCPGFVVRNVPQVTSELLGEYYRAANLNVWLSPTDSCYRTVGEAALCALPTLAFDIGAADKAIEHNKTGFLIKQLNEQELYIQLGRATLQPRGAAEIGAAAYRRYKNMLGSCKQGLAAYIGLYERILGREETKPVTDIVMSLVDYKKHMASDVDKAFSNGWGQVAAHVREKLERDFAGRSPQERCAYADLFCTQALTRADWRTDRAAVWRLMAIWREVRGLSNRPSFQNPEQKAAFMNWGLGLRKVLVDYFTHVKLEDFGKATKDLVGPLAHVWRALFLDVQSELHLAADKFECPKEFLKFNNPTGYPFTLLKMMYVPYVDDQSRMDIPALMRSGLPNLMKMLMIFWGTSAPLYNGNELNRKNVLTNISAACKCFIKRNNKREIVVNRAFAEHFMVSLWRAAYLGGNNRPALETFGQFTQYVAGQLAPDYTKELPLRKRKKNEPLRIGYISMNFRSQAVSQYMVNRLEYADHKKFFVKTFILRRFNDAMTDKIRSYSDETVDFTNFDDIAGMAKEIRESNLDMLIYTDIGMEITTYLLGSLHLAPVQAVLVGHGTTTGLSTIDYYVSGDHEPKNAQEHYTEEIVRLPLCGAAQRPPLKSERKMERADVQVPAKAVLFISCANGLKHYPARDDLLIKILEQAPNAYILLKPFLSQGTMDGKFSHRIMEKARKAGVDNRMKVAGPLPNAGDLMSLLTLADVQLDTYPYGGWTTNLEALYYGLPIVTQEGDLARNRWGAGLLRAIGTENGIAHDEKEYVEWAVRFAKDEALRKETAQLILDRAKPILFNGQKMQKSYEDVLLRIASGRKKK